MNIFFHPMITDNHHFSFPGILFAILTIIPGGTTHAQFPFALDSSGGRRIYQKRFILLESREKPTLYKIAEKQKRDIVVEGDTNSIPSKITRIRRDSIYLDGKGYRFSQVKSVFIKYRAMGQIMYRRSDSASWKLFFPPDSVYNSRFALSEYMHWVSKIRKHDKFEWLAPPFRHNLVKFNFSRLANLEIAFSYEGRFTKNWSCEIETGFQFDAGKNLSSDGPLDVYPLYKYSGFSVITGPKYYFNSRGYVQAMVHYRYLEMVSAQSRFPADIYLMQDQFRNDAGFSIRLGQLIRMGDMIVDGYFGLGIKAMFIRQYAYGSYSNYDGRYSWYNNQHTPTMKDMVYWYPIIGLGIKLGFGF
jgi:hypothetical protein